MNVTSNIVTARFKDITRDQMFVLSIDGSNSLAMKTYYSTGQNYVDCTMYLSPTSIDANPCSIWESCPDNFVVSVEASISTSIDINDFILPANIKPENGWIGIRGEHSPIMCATFGTQESHVDLLTGEVFFMRAANPVIYVRKWRIINNQFNCNNEIFTFPPETPAP